MTDNLTARKEFLLKKLIDPTHCEDRRIMAAIALELISIREVLDGKYRESAESGSPK